MIEGSGAGSGSVPPTNGSRSGSATLLFSMVFDFLKDVGFEFWPLTQQMITGTGNSNLNHCLGFA